MPLKGCRVHILGKRTLIRVVEVSPVVDVVVAFLVPVLVVFVEFGAVVGAWPTSDLWCTWVALKLAIVHWT